MQSHPVVEALAADPDLKLYPVGSRSTGEAVYATTDYDFVATYDHKSWDQHVKITERLTKLGFVQQLAGGYSADSDAEHWRANGAKTPYVDVLVMTDKEWAFRQPILAKMPKDLRVALKGSPWGDFWRFMHEVCRG